MNKSLAQRENPKRFVPARTSGRAENIDMEELMVKTKPAAAAAKAEIEKPYVMAKSEPGPQKTLRHLTSLDARPGEVEEREPIPPTRGPMTGVESMKDAEFLGVFATKEELAVFRAAVQARRARAETVGWTTLPDGRRIRANMVLGGCPSCGRWLWLKEAKGQPCPVCNLNIQSQARGGHIRPATPEEQAEWFARETKNHQKWIAAGPARQKEIDAANLRRFQDGKA